MKKITWLVLTVSLLSSMGNGSINITYTVNTENERASISPYIYGFNFDHVTCENMTVRRMGGNRTTGYNWENNFSNAGNDWYHHSDRYMSNYLPPSQQLIPGKVYYDFHQENLNAERATILTLQMAGYVAADDYGTVEESETAPSARWKEVVYKKPTASCSPPGNPDTGNDYVYMDEFVNYLVSEFGDASSANSVQFYSLDNEPALWGSTHVRIHPTQPTCVEIKDRSIALSSAVKDVDPYAQITGPTLYGFNAFHSFQDAPDWGALQTAGGYNWFLDYYLDELEAASNSQGRRLLDVLDLHWYPEAQDDNGVRITTFQATDTNYTTRMQAPRSLWDSAYTENSWIGTWFSDHLPLLPEVFSSINTYYPGTKLAFTEYNYGGHDHISGGIAQADVLGIFGKYGVYMSTYWGSNGSYTNAAYRLYRNYDGSNSTYGDTKVDASMSDTVNSSVYASMFTGINNQLHLIVLNKNLTETINGTFNLSSPCPYTSGRVWVFNDSSSSITEIASISSIVDNSFSYNIPPLTACHMVLQSERPLGDLSGNCQVGIEDLALFCNQWLAEDDFIASDCADFTQDDHIDMNDLGELFRTW